MTHTFWVQDNHNQQLKSHPKSIRLRYALVVAYLKNRQPKKALHRLARLMKEHPDETLFEISKSRAYQLENRLNKALIVLKNLHHYEPDNEAVLVVYAKTLMQANQNKKALSILWPLRHDFKNHIAFVKTLYQAQAKTGHLKQLYLTRAQLFALLNHYKASIAQLHRALALEKNKALQRTIRRKIKAYEAEDETLERFSI